MSSRSEHARISKSVKPILPTERRFGLPLSISYNAVPWCACTLDALVIVLAALAGSYTYHYFALSSTPDFERSVGMGILCASLHGAIGLLSGSYELSRLLESHKQMGRLIGTFLFSVVLVTLFLFLLKIGATFSRGAVLSFAGFSVAGLIAARVMVARNLHYAIDRGLLSGKPTVVIGDEEELQNITPRMLLNQHGMTMLGRITLSCQAPCDTLSCQAPCYPAYNTLIELANSRPAAAIALAFKWTDSECIAFAREQLRRVPLPVYLLPDGNVGALIRHSALNSNSYVIELQREPLTAVELLSKRGLDLVVASVTLFLLSPLLALAAIAIKLDSRGPVIFRQRRQGFNGKIFHIYKFRSMTVLEDGEVIRQAKKHDNRVTRIGRILRRTSIDELPQLFNVLKGEMSLVGPRPHALAHDDKYGRAIASYAFRQHVKPGITGWAQVNGLRGETSSIEQMQKRVDHDLWYITNWSLWLDLRILVRTCFVVLGQPAAY